MKVLNPYAALAAACIVGVLALHFPEKALAQTPPKIEFNDVPEADCGGPVKKESLAGKVTGATEKQRLVIFALACNGVLYVQPEVAAPFTSLDSEGKFDAFVYLGQAYYVLLVNPGYKPDAQIASIPQKGGDIVAVFKVNGKKK